MTLDLNKLLSKLSDNINYNNSPISIVLAAGHGKRIKSDKSKMLHEIWGVPSAKRVTETAIKGLNSDNAIIVVGIKAEEVASSIGKTRNRLFAFQEKQNGTGHAAMVALDLLDSTKKVGDIYIFPGDMGLLTETVVKNFREGFENSNAGMMILTGLYEGNSKDNYYGRIVRVPKSDSTGNMSGIDEGKVIEIKEHKDILALGENENYLTDFNNKQYKFSKQELINITEYNSGVYAVKFDYINKFIREIGTNNVQGEVYITDLISIMNNNDITVGAFPTTDNDSVMGFNTKSVLYEMNNIYKNQIYDKIKDIVTIEDKNDFYIADKVVENILNMAEKSILDIEIGKGTYIGKNVILNKKVILERGVVLDGNIEIGENSILEKNVTIKNDIDESVKIGKNCQIKSENKIIGQVVLGDNVQINYNTSISGSIKKPIVIKNNAKITGIINNF